MLNDALISEFKIVEKVVEVKAEEIQTENLESTITVSAEEFSDETENKEEQSEQTINDKQEQDQEFQEETQAILNIVNNVA